MIKYTQNTRYELLIRWLKTVRLEQELTTRELAELIDEHHQFVSKVERGERRLNVYEYVQYCNALKVDPREGLALLQERNFNKLK